MVKKTFTNKNMEEVKQKVPDIVTFGDGDSWLLICKASSNDEGWMKSTKAMQVGNGVLVQVTTQQTNPDGSYAIAEALTYVPYARIELIKGMKDEIIGRRIFV